MPVFPQTRVVFLALLTCILTAADPTISTITPDSGGSTSDGMTSATVLVVSGTADAGSTIELLGDAAPIPTTVVGGPLVVAGAGTWTCTVDTRLTAGGQLRFQARATLVADVRLSAVRTMTVDTGTTAPELLAISLDSGVAADLRTADSTLLLIGAAEAGATLTVGLDGQTRIVVGGSDGRWTADFTAHTLPDGTYPVTMDAVDVAGNSASRTASLIIDTAPPPAPAFTSLDADTGVSTNDFSTTDNTVVLHGAAEAGATVNLFIDGLQLARTTADAGGAWIADLRSTALPNGIYQLTARATDAVGNAGPLSPPQPVVIQNAAPTAIRIVALLDDTGIIGDHRTADAEIMLAGYGQPLTDAVLFQDGVAVATTTTAANGAFTFDLTAVSLADRTYQFVARGTDAAGHPVNSEPFSVGIERAKPRAPELIAIRLDSGIDGDWITNDNTLEISGTADPSSLVRVMLDGRVLGLALCGGNGQWVCDLTRWELPEGIFYSVTAIATNANGQDSLPSQARQLLIDPTEPPSPTLVLNPDTGDFSNDHLTNAAPVGVGGTGQDGLEVRVTVDGFVVTTVTVSLERTWHAILPGLSSDGHYRVVAEQLDRAGNASAPVEIEAVIDRSIIQPVFTALANDSGLPGDRITSDATPTLTGAADPQGRVFVVVDGVDLGNVFADAGGAWSMPTSTAWADGTHQVTLRGEDAAGNAIGPGFVVAVTIDTTPPAAPVITAISDDTGVSNADFITSDQTLVLHGTAEPGAVVVVAVAGLQVGVAPVATNGTWSFDAQGTVLPAGTFAVSAHATDIAGNASPEATEDVVIEPIATDDVTILAASPDSGVVGDHITNGEPVVLTGLATPGSTVTVTPAGGGTSLGTAVTDAGGVWTLSLVALPAGPHDFVASSVDQAGNPGGPSAVFQLVIDRTAPLAPTIALTPDTGDSASDGLTKANPVGIGGNGEAGASLLITIDGSFAATLTVPGNGIWSTSLPSLTNDGQYALAAVQTDVAGNASPPAALTTVVDRSITQPVLTSLATDSGLPGDRIINDATPTLTGTADPLTRVTIVVDGVDLTTVQATAGGVWTTTATTLTDGVHQVTLRGADAAGNLVGPGAPVAVTIDTTFPAAPVLTAISTDTGTSNSDFVTTDQTLILHGTAEPGTSVQVAIVARQLATVPVAPDGTWSFDAQGTTLPGGTYAVSAHVIDVAGNVGPGATRNVVIDLSSTFDVTILAVSPDSGVLGDHITNADPVALTGLAEPLSTVTVVNQADGATLGTIATNASGVWILSPLSLPEGAYDFEASSLDLAGNPSATSAVFPLVIDRTAPGAPTIALDPDTGDSASDHLTNATPVGVGGSGEAGASLTILINGSAVTTVTVPADGTWHTTLSGMTTDGLYHLSAVQADAADNASSVTPTLDVVVDRSLSQPALTTLATDSGLPGDRITNDTTPTLTGTADPLTRVLVTVDGGAPTTVTADAGGVWTLTTSTLADGTHQVTLRGADAAGNTVGPGAAVAVIVDATSPAAPLITTITDDTGASDSDFITSDQSLVLYGTAEPRTVLTLAVAGMPVDEFVVEVDGTWIFDLRDIALPHGVYAFTAYATDVAGNVGPDTARNVTIDVTSQEVTILALSTDSGVVGDHITNADPVVLTGLAEPASTVTVVNQAGGATLGTVLTDASGAWSLSLLSLPAGVYDVVASSVDLAGNPGGPSAAFHLVIDRSAPVAPTIALIPDTGDSASDGLTNANPVGIGGSGEAGASLTITIDGSVATTLTVPAGGTWQTTLPSLTTDGFYLLVAVQTDVAGNASPSAVLTAVVDRSLTQPVLTSLATDSGLLGDRITNDTTPALTGTADPLTRVLVTVDGVLMTTVQATAGGIWTTTTTTLANGTHAVTLRGADAAGNAVGPGAAVAVTIDTTLPAAPVITAITDDTGASSTDFVTTDQTLVLHGMAELGATVQVAVAGQPVGKVPVAADGTWSFDAQNTVLPGGVYAVSAHAIDVAGNVGPDATRNVVIDLTSTYDVTIFAVSPDSGVLGDRITNGDPVELAGLAEPLSTVTIVNQAGGATLGTAVTDAGGVWTLSLVALPAGSYDVVASSVDLAGNPGGPSAAFHLVIDRSAPVAPTIALDPDTGDSASDHLTNATPVGVGGSGEVGANLTVTIDGIVAATLTVPATGLWHATLPSLTSDGQYSLVAMQVDVAGNASPATPALTAVVDRSLTQPVLSSLATDSGLPSDRITNDTTPTLTGTADPLTRVLVTVDGVLMTTVQATAGGAWSATTTALAGGIHQVTLRGADAAGNAVGPGAAVTVTIDTTLPAAPVFTAITDDTGTSSSDFITIDQTLVVHGTAEPGATVQMALAARQLAQVPVAADGTWSFDAQGTILPGGTYAVSAHAIDVAGNVGPDATRNVVIDLTSTDDVTIFAASPDSGVLGDHITNADPVELAGLAEPSSTVTVSRAGGGASLGTAVTDAGGVWTLTLVALPTGAYDLVASSVDLAGNPGGPSTAFHLVIDRTAPVVPTIALTTDTGDSASDGLTNANPVGVGGSAEPGGTLTITRDGAVAATLTVPPSGTWNTTLPGMSADGHYLLVAVQADVAGNASPSAVLTAVVDRSLTQPVLSSLAADSGLPSDRITNDTTPTLTGTADPLTRVVIVVDGVDLATVQATAGGVWSTTTTALANGTHQVTLRGADAAGNAVGPGVAVAVTIDTTLPAAPAITAITTDTGASSSDFITTDQTLVVHGTAEPGATVQVALAARQLAQVPVAADGTWSFDVQGTVLPGGVYAVSAHAIDVAGNVGPDATRNVVIDLTATYDVTILAVSPDSGVLGDHITSANPVALVGLAEPLSTVTVVNQAGGATLGTAVTNASGVWTLPLLPLPEGAHDVVASSVDLAGNPGGTSATFHLVIDRSAPVAPSIALDPDTGDSAGDHLTNATPVGVGGSGEVGANLTVTIDGTVAATLTVPATGLWHATLPSLTSDGQYSLVAMQMDVAGNASPATTPALTAVVDRSLTQPVLTSLATDSGLPGDRNTNDTTPTLTGTADPLTRVLVEVDGVLMTTVQASAAGVWTTTTTALADGIHQVTLRGADAAGNAVGPGAAVTVTIDATLPAAPVITSITDDSGASTSDFITSDQTLLIQGTAEVGAEVAVAVAGQPVGVVSVAADGTWSCDAQGAILPEGVYAIAAHATDVAGNVGLDAIRNVTIDVTSHEVAILGMSPDSGVVGDHITSADPVSLTGLAEPASTVTVVNQAGGTTLGTALTDAGGAWSLSLLSLPVGAYDVAASSVDRAGNPGGPSAAFHFVIDRTAPVAPTIALVPDTGDSAGDSLTNATPVGVGGNGEAGASLTIAINGSVAATLTVAANGTWSTTLPGMSTDGSYLLSVKQLDVAGNASPPAVLIAVVDRSLGQPMLTSLATDSGPLGDQITNDATPTLTGTADPLTRVLISVDGGASTMVQADANGAWSMPTTLGNGPHPVTLRGEDAAGNAVGPGATVVVTIDTTPPAAPVITAITTDTGTSNSDFITTDQTLMLHGTAEPGTTVQVAVAARQLATVPVDGNGDWSFDAQGTLLPGGTYAVSAHAIDAAGNVGPDGTQTVVIDLTSTFDVTILAVSPDSGRLGDRITNAEPVTLTGLAEPASTVIVVNRADGATLGTTVTNAGGVWILSPLSLPEGAYDFEASSVDLAGNPSATSAAFHLVIDRTAPVVPTIALDPDTGDSTSDRLTNASPVGVGGSGEAGANLTVLINGSVAATLTVPANGTWHTTLPDMTTDGQYSLVAMQADVADNASPATPMLAVAVDRGLSQPVLTSLSTDSGRPGDWITNDATPTLAGTADPLTRVLIVVDGGAPTNVQADAGGVWATTTSALANGVHQVTLRGEDAAGNAVGPGAAIAVTIDATLPAAPVITAITADTGASSADFITTDQTLVLHGTAELGAAVQVAAVGRPLAVVPVANDGTWSFDARGTVLPGGAYAVSAHVIDVAGNVGPDATQTVEIEPASPHDVTILAASPDSGVLGDHITNAEPVELAGLADPASTVTVRHAGGATLGTTTTDASGVWTLSLAALPDGAYDFEASSVDLAGNPGGPSAMFPLLLDRSTPVPTVDAVVTDSAMPGDFITDDPTPTLSGTAEAGSTVAISLRGAVVGSAVADPAGAWSLTVPDTLLDGDYTVLAQAVDVAGNGADDVDGRILIVDTTLDQPRIVSITPDSNIVGDFVTSDLAPTFTGSAEPAAVVELTIDGVTLATVPTDSSGTWSTGSIVMADGTHAVVALATDRAGNVRASLARSVIIDSAMAAPEIVEWSPDTGVPGDLLTGTGSIVLSGLGEAGSQLVLHEGGDQLAQVLVGPTGTWTYSFAGGPLSDGPHAVSVTTTDLAGNIATSATPLTITIDTVAPTRPVIERVENDAGELLVYGQGTHDPRLRVIGSGEPDAELIVLVNDVEAARVQAAADGSWTWQTPTDLLPGETRFSARTTDAAGNESDPADPYLVVIVADARQISVDGCGSGSVFAMVLLLALGLMAWRRPSGGGGRVPLLLLLGMLTSTSLLAVEPVDWEWGLRLNLLPSPTEDVRVQSGSGTTVPTGSWESTPSFGAFIRRSAPLGEDGLLWGLEIGINGSRLSGKSKPSDGGDAQYDRDLVVLMGEGRVRIGKSLGPTCHLGLAAILAAGPALTEVSGTATAGGITSDLSSGSGTGLSTSYGLAADAAWVISNDHAWTLFAEVGYLFNRTSFNYEDRFIQGGNVVATDTYTVRVDQVGVVAGLGLMHRW